MTQGHQEQAADENRQAVRTGIAGLLMLELIMLCTVSSRAGIFADRATIAEYHDAVDHGTWCGKALEERRNVTVGGGSVLPQCASQQQYAQDLKGWTTNLAPHYLDDTKANGDSFDTYFAQGGNWNKTCFPTSSASIIAVDMWFKGHVSTPGWFDATPWRLLSSQNEWENLRLAISYLAWTASYDMEWTNCRQTYAEGCGPAAYSWACEYAYSNYLNDLQESDACTNVVGVAPMAVAGWIPEYQQACGMASIAVEAAPKLRTTYAAVTDIKPFVDFYAAFVTTNPAIGIACLRRSVCTTNYLCGTYFSTLPPGAKHYWQRIEADRLYDDLTAGLIFSVIGDCDSPANVCGCLPMTNMYPYSRGWNMKEKTGFVLRWDTPNGFSYGDVRP